MFSSMIMDGFRFRIVIMIKGEALEAVIYFTLTLSPHVITKGYLPVIISSDDCRLQRELGEHTH